MAKKMLIDATHPEETRVVVVDGARIEEFDYESITKIQIAGNIYLAKVTRVEPSLQAAFVDYGGNRHGFLAFTEIHPDYYQIPKADREALLAAEREAEAADEEAAEEETETDRGNGRRAGRRQNKRRSERGDRRRRDADRGRDNDRTRGDRIGLRPLTEADAPPSAAVAVAETAGAGFWGHPDLSAVLAGVEAPVDAPADAAPTEIAAAPDLSDVSEIEIHRAPSPEEAAETGDAPIVERYEIGADGGIARIDPSADDGETGAVQEGSTTAQETAQQETADQTDAVGATAAQAEAAGVRARDVVAGEMVAGAAEADADAGSDRIAEARTRDADEPDADTPDADDPEADQDDANGAEGAGEVEEVGAEDAREEIRPRRVRMRDYKIQEVIKKRQILLVQVVKEERGTKGAALTTYLSLAGRYCVLMPNTARGGGISRKITNAADRKRLKAVAQELDVPDGMGLIIRTAGANRTKAEIKRDYEYLLRQWAAIRELTLSSIAPTLIYEEGSLIKRAIRDLYNKDIDAVVVEGDEGYREAKDYMKMLMPSHAKNVQPYREATPLFIRHQVESQMAGMLNPTVQLKSGGYIVIGVTEALVAVDVNSGRSTKEGSIEDTALKTNLEAAEEVARQLKLRDLAGLIVIDFIDMEESKNNRAVEKRLKDRLKTDRARIQLSRISAFGLLEMSRQRLRPGLLEATTSPCPHCKGTGVIRSDESLALTVLRAVEEEGVRGRSAAVKVVAPVSVTNYLLNVKRRRVAQIEERYSIQVVVEGDPGLVSPDFSVDRVKPSPRDDVEVTARAIQVESGYAHRSEEEDDDDLIEADEDEAVIEERDASPARARRRRRKQRSDAAETSGDMEATTSIELDDAVEETSDARATDDEKSDDEKSAGAKKRRGRRGGRRRKRSSEDDGSDPLPVIDLDADADADADQEETALDIAATPPASDRQREAIEASASADSSDEESADAAARLAQSAVEDADATADDVGADLLSEQATTSSSDDDRAPRPTPHSASDAEAAPAIIVAPKTEADPILPGGEAATGREKEPALEAEAVLETESAAAETKPSARRRTGWWAFRRGA